jgi:hypothetical protein
MEAAKFLRNLCTHLTTQCRMPEDCILTGLSNTARTGISYTKLNDTVESAPTTPLGINSLSHSSQYICLTPFRWILTEQVSRLVLVLSCKESPLLLSDFNQTRLQISVKLSRMNLGLMSILRTFSGHWGEHKSGSKTDMAYFCKISLLNATEFSISE